MRAQAKQDPHSELVYNARESDRGRRFITIYENHIVYFTINVNFSGVYESIIFFISDSMTVSSKSKKNRVNEKK